jgi:hypothetical protein
MEVVRACRWDLSPQADPGPQPGGMRRALDREGYASADGATVGTGLGGHITRSQSQSRCEQRRVLHDVGGGRGRVPRRPDAGANAQLAEPPLVTTIGYGSSAILAGVFGEVAASVGARWGKSVMPSAVLACGSRAVWKRLIVLAFPPLGNIVTKRGYTVNTRYCRASTLHRAPYLALQAEQPGGRRITVLPHLGPASCRCHASASCARSQVLFWQLLRSPQQHTAPRFMTKRPISQRSDGASTIVPSSGYPASCHACRPPGKRRRFR